MDLALAIPVTWLAAAIGCIPGIAVRGFQDTFFSKLLNSLAGGVLLSLAFVHILVEAHEKMSDHGIAFPVSHTCACIAIIAMAIIDNLLKSYKNSGSNSSNGTNTDASTTHMPFINDAYDADSEQEHKHAGDHTHDCPNTAVAVSRGRVYVNDAMLLMFELACMIHSFMLGLMMGTLEDGGMRMLIPVSLHQFIEGVTVGTMLARGNTKNALWWCLILVAFCTALPMGIVTGTVIMDGDTRESDAGVWVEGVLGGISAGALMYTSIVQLILEEFTSSGHSMKSKLCLYASLLTGAVGMSAMAMFE